MTISRVVFWVFLRVTDFEVWLQRHGLNATLWPWREDVDPNEDDDWPFNNR